MKRFDRKFGADFVTKLPTTPAVYLFKDAAERVIYVGKAKDVRKRLSAYRNASRRKVHAKMRAIVAAAATLDVRLQASEEDALVLENELIRTLEPAFNVAGKYSFLYPAFGLAHSARHTLLCFTTDVSAWAPREFEWFGTFPSRPRAKEAFDALVTLLGFVGHLERTSSLGDVPDVVGSRLAGVRQLDPALVESLRAFLRGADSRALRELSVALLSKPRARRQAPEVQALMSCAQRFYEADLKPLHDALRVAGRDGTFVPQAARDTLFIQHG